MNKYKAYCSLAWALVLQRWQSTLQWLLALGRALFPHWFEPAGAQLLRATLVRRKKRGVLLLDITAPLRRHWRTQARTGLPWRCGTANLLRECAPHARGEAIVLEYSLHGKGVYGAWFDSDAELVLPPLARARVPRHALKEVLGSRRMPAGALERLKRWAGPRGDFYRQASGAAPQWWLRYVCDDAWREDAGGGYRLAPALESDLVVSVRWCDGSARDLVDSDALF